MRVRIVMLVLAVAGALLTGATAAVAGVPYDGGFGDDGWADMRFWDRPYGDQAFSFTNTDVAVAPDGKIVAVGKVEYRGDDRFAAMRLLPDGTRDPSFGYGGLAFVNTGDWDRAEAVAIDDHGRIIAAGWSRCGLSSTCFTMARFTTSGGLDTAFGNEGIVRTQFRKSGSRVYSHAHDVAIDRDGRIVLAGLRDDAGIYDITKFALARYHANGSLDTSFGRNGRKVITSMKGASEAHAVAIRRTGGIVVAGMGFRDADRTWRDMMVAQLKPNGRLDRSFSGDGMTGVDFGNGASDVAYGMTLSGGRITLAGHSYRDYDLRMAVARLTRSGGADTTFSGDGKRLLSFGDSDAAAHDVVVDGRGRAVLPGELITAPDAEDQRSYWVIVRLREGGRRDRTFSGDGIARPTFWTSDDYGNSVARQRNGRLVFGGVTYGGHGIVRLTP